MIALFRLIRLPNLIVIAITQWVVAVAILARSASLHGLNPALDSDQLILLILATLNISAAAYCINDVLDYTIDLVNHPEKVIINKHISVGTVYWLILCFTIFGFICSLILALQKNELEFLWLYPFFTMLLGGYSRIFKMRPFVGNLLIAGSCAGVTALVWLAERVTWQAFPIQIKEEISHLLIVFMVYAFLATWIREIVKDLEDYQGDILGGRKTLPIAYGEKKAKWLIHFLAGLLALILAVNAFYWGDFSTQLPVVILSGILWTVVVYMQWLLHDAKSQSDYHYLSSLWKYFMLGGLILLFLYQN